MSNTRNEDKWAEAKRRCRLSQEELEAARKMGLNPLSLIKNIPNPSERWKAPVSVWIRNIYEKRYGRPLGRRSTPPPRPPSPRLRAPEPPAIPPEFDEVFGKNRGRDTHFPIANQPSRSLGARPFHPPPGRLPDTASL